MSDSDHWTDDEDIHFLDERNASERISSRIQSQESVWRQRCLQTFHKLNFNTHELNFYYRISVHIESLQHKNITCLAIAVIYVYGNMSINSERIQKLIESTQVQASNLIRYITLVQNAKKKL